MFYNRNIEVSKARPLRVTGRTRLSLNTPFSPWALHVWNDSRLISLPNLVTLSLLCELLSDPIFSCFSNLDFCPTKTIYAHVLKSKCSTQPLMKTSAPPLHVLLPKATYMSQVWCVFWSFISANNKPFFPSLRLPFEALCITSLCGG